MDKIKYSTLNDDKLDTGNNNDTGIPFTGKFFENIFSVLKQLGITCIPLIHNNISDVVIKSKDKFSKNIQANIIYKFSNHKLLKPNPGHFYVLVSQGFESLLQHFS